MSNKKIGLAIVYKYPDYGSMLQALATQLTLRNMGYESEAINTDNLQASIKKRKYKYFAENIFDFSIVKEKSKIIWKKLRQKFDKKFGENQRIRERAFDRFNKNYFVESKSFVSWAELSRNCSNKYDAVLVGSDQLWLPSNVEADYYTLSFAPDEVKKVCYATSFGISVVPEKYGADYKRMLTRINFLSAREISGQKIIKDLTGRDAPLVCDPAMLLNAEKWDAIATKDRIVKDRYVFCYFMGDNPEQRVFARKLADKNKCKIVALLHLDQYIASDEKYADYTPYDVSPSDFINLIKNAEYVCTDSFHGTVFSIIYSKNFFTFKRFNKKASLSTNTRLDSLLNRLSLSDRLYSAKENVDSDFHISDYATIQNRVSEFREASLKYLRAALEA